MATQLPQIPGYFALRVGADLASSIRNQTLYLNYAPGSLQVMSPSTPGTPPGQLPGVPVTTPSLAPNRPQVTGATITLGGQSLPLAGDQYGALFWTESAVEKFLLPYYVSAGGPHAYQVLHAINKSWYNYTVATPVCALAFAYPSVPTDGPVQLWDTLSVVYLQDGTLTIKPLLDFLATQPPPQANPIAEAAPPPRVTPPPVDTVAHPIDSQDAREVAEYVSGLRGNKVDVYAVELGGGLDPVLSPEGDGPPLFTAESPQVRTDRPVPTVTLTYTWMGETNVLQPLLNLGGSPVNVPDSVFWTDAAVELLMLPYYASVEGAAAPWYLALILGTWSGVIDPGIEDGAVVLSQILQALNLRHPRAKATTYLDHVAEEVAEVVEEAVAVEEMTETATTSSVIGLIHLPNSEWVDRTVTGGTGPTIYLEHRTGVLTPTGTFPLTPPGQRLVSRHGFRG